MILLSALSTCLLSTFPGWSEEIDDTGSDIEVKPFPSSKASQGTLAVLSLALLLTVISIIWQHTASVASTTTLQAMTYGTVHTEVGVVAMVLGWVGLVLIVLSFVGILASTISVFMLESLSD